ncbi:hypothetical protein BJ742DRAFT_747759 [Cladochytrium replicatum]|nr:hypothetical protein BJ742DRAFT_747759 [Cladochytrium replicatum]
MPHPKTNRDPRSCPCVWSEQLGYPPPPGASELLRVEFAGVYLTKRSLISGGAYAEFALVDYRLAVLLLQSLSFEIGVSIPENWMTAYKALFYSCQIKGEHLIVTAGSQDKIDRCLEWGAIHGINYKREQFANKVSEITDGNGVDCLVNFVGGDYWDANLAALGMDCRMVMLGSLAGLLYITPTLIQGSTLRSRDLDFQSKLKNKIVSNVLPHIVNGKLKVVIDTVYPWPDIKEAQKRMESNSNVGKFVVVIN